MVERLNPEQHRAVYNILLAASKEYKRTGSMSANVGTAYWEKWVGGAVHRQPEECLLLTPELKEQLVAAGVEESIFTKPFYGRLGIKLSDLSAMMGDESAERIVGFSGGRDHARGM